MINPNCWRTPIPVDIHTCESIDPLSRMLFFEILTLCQNKEYNKSFYHGNKFINITLNRWECVFVVSKYEKSLKIGNKRIKKSLEMLSKWYNEMGIESKAFWLIIKLKNYDEIIKMENEMANERKTKGKRKENEDKSTNKSVKSEKNEKKLYISLIDFYNSLANKKLRLTDWRKKKIQTRLQNFTEEEIKTAMKNYTSDSFIIANYLNNLDWLLESDEKIDKWLNKTNSLPKQNSEPKSFEDNLKYL